MTPTSRRQPLRPRWLALVVALVGCEGAPPKPAAPVAQPPQAKAAAPAPAPRPVEPPTIRFIDATDSSGIDFVHCSGNSAEKYAPTANGSGVALLDYDRDGLLDVYFATTRNLPLSAPTTSKGNRLYRNKGGGRFEDVTEKANVGFHGFTHGLAAGDLDNNGYPDLYLANLGNDVVYLNNGDGTFRSVPVAPEVKGRVWSSAPALFDFDEDGDLDVYVSCYGKWTFEEEHPYCGDSARKIRMYCVPGMIPPERHFLLRNKGNGTFEDATESAGFLRRDGRGFGVVATDLDGDGHVDLFVGNDGCPNFLFMNRGDGTFEDASESSGASATEAGFLQAGMGVDAADVNGDGRPDLLLTTYRGEYDTLFMNMDGKRFLDVSARAGIVRDSMPEVGWGCALADFDNDGAPDMLVVNGHVDDNLVALGKDDVGWAERSKVFRNLSDGRFKLVADPGPFFEREHVARGAAFGDLDNDGDIDAIVSRMDERPAVLLNVSQPRAWIGLDLRETAAQHGREAIGARVTVHVGDKILHRQVKGGGSYLSSSDPRLTIGLGAAARVDRVEIRWPSGGTTTLTAPELGRYHVVRAPAGRRKP